MTTTTRLHPHFVPKEFKAIADIPELSPAELYEALTELARKRFFNFLKRTCGETYVAGWVHEELAKELDDFYLAVEAKQSPRLMIFMPPRHGKSEEASRKFPAYALGRNPDLEIIATSYSADLASSMNRDVQRVIDSEAYRELFPGTQLNGSNIRTVADGSYLRNSDIFEVVGCRGSYKSAGVGGGITGRGGDILICDDPIKDAKEAESETVRDAVWDWWKSTFYTRLMPGGGMLLIMTRWHENDLAGRLLEEMKNGGEQWRVVEFPAIAEKDEKSVHDGRLLRKKGEALHEARYPLDQLNRIRTAVGGRVWSALFQQKPKAAEGQIYKRAWWKYHKTPEHSSPADLAKKLGLEGIVQFWDTAFKAKASSDRSACVTIGVTESKYIVLDVWAGRVEFPALVGVVKTQYAKWYETGLMPNLLVEDKASGQSLVQSLQQDTRLPVLPVPVDRDKVARANAITPLIEAGRVSLPEDQHWVADFVDELSGFPNATHDDCVDAFNGALEYAARGGGATGMLDWIRVEFDKAEKAKKESKTQDNIKVVQYA